MPTQSSVISQQGLYWNVGGTVWSRPVVPIRNSLKSLDLSKGHYGYPDFPSDRNVGGALIIREATTDWGVTPNQRWDRSQNSANTVYDGIWAANIAAYGINSIAPDGHGYAADAYNRMKPTKPSMSLANSIYELKDIPGMLRQRFHFNRLHELGNYHLALQFGWLPLLQDTLKFVETQRKAQSRLLWLLRHNGKPVRRRVTLAETVSDPVESSGTAYGALTPTLATQFYTTQPTWIQKVWSNDKVWASARFRYHLPDGPGEVEWTRKMLRRIYGLYVSPLVVYKAIPWSWLNDWFFNVGNVIANMEPGVADRLAADYFYVMREAGSTKTYDVKATLKSYLPGSSSYTNTPIALSSISRQITKTRLMGDPFGIDTNQNSLTASQLAILGALGLSRVR